MSRASRRADRARLAVRVKSRLKLWGGSMDAARVSRLVETHMVPCSCPGCSGERYDRRLARRAVARELAEAP